MTDRDNGATGRAPAATEAFRAARDFLLRHREDYDAARDGVPLAPPRALQLGPGLVRRHRRAATTAPPCTSSRRTAPRPG